MSCPPKGPVRTRTPLHPGWLILFFSIFGCPVPANGVTEMPLGCRVFSIQLGVLDAAWDGSQNQVESKPAIEAEVVASPRRKKAQIVSNCVLAELTALNVTQITPL